MRIVIDARQSGTSTGRYIDKLIEYLYKLKPDFEFIILTKTERLDYLKKLAPNWQILPCPYKEFSFAEQTGFLKQIKNLSPDLVHFGMTQQPARYDGKVVTTIHDLTTARFINPAKNPLVYKFKQQVYKWLIKKVARKSHKLITPTNYVKSDVAQYAKISPDKIVVTYEAADKIAAPAKSMPNLVHKQFLLYVGQALPHKNLPHLIEAFVKLQKSRPELSLVLAGKFDANYQKLKVYADKVGANNVVFTDFVSDGQLRWLYQNAEVYVFASLSEGFGLPGLEAMVHGLPVVSSSATCLPEVYKDAAAYFDPEDVSDMAAKISQVIDDKKLAENLRQKGQKIAGQYSWQTMAEQTLKVYKQVLDT